MIQNQYRFFHFVSIFLFGAFSLYAQTTKSYDNFYNDYLKANFLDTKLIDIKSYSFEAFEESSLKNLIKGSDSIKIYSKRPYYSRTEYTFPNKRTYCFNGTELLKISSETNYKPQPVQFSANQTLQPATFSVFLNGFISRNSLMSTNQIEKFIVASDSTIIDGKRYYKLTQKLDEELSFEYLIDYHSLLLLRERTIKNGACINQIDYENYKIVDGINVPFKRINKSFESITIDRTLLKFSLNPSYPPDFFNCL